MKLKTLIGTAILIVGAYSGFWYYLAYYAEDYALARAGDLAQYGIEFSYRDLKISGFPYSVVIDFDGANIRLTQGNIRLDWHANALQAITQPWNFRHVTLSSAGPVISVVPGSAGRAFVIEPDLLEAKFRVDAAGVVFLSFSLDSFVATTSGRSRSGLSADQASLSLRLFPAPTATDQGANLIEPALADIAFAISGMLPRSEAPSAAPNIKSDISFDASIRGPFMPRLTPYSLAAWRDAGGTIEIDALSLLEKQATLFRGAGSLTLDEALRPLGALSIEAEDMPRTLAWLRDVGFVSIREYNEVIAALRSLSAILNSGGSRSAATPLTLPVTLQDGRVYIGPVPIAHLEPVVQN